MRPKIAVALPARTSASALRMIRSASRLGADLAEIRLDYLDIGQSIKKIVQSRELPLIATFRSSRNGGAGSLSEPKRVELLISTAKTGFDYVDIELETRNLNNVVRQLHSAGVKTIVSHHDFKRTHSQTELRRVLQLCRRSGATISKLVTTVKSVEDNLHLLDLTREESKKGEIVCFGMGELSVESRVFSPMYGAAFTFASLDDGIAVAPGQISVSGMRHIYKEMGYT
ncbi:MAG: type I 3-dehydroquinate dehydratase [archaeon]